MQAFVGMTTFWLAPGDLYVFAPAVMWCVKDVFKGFLPGSSHHLHRPDGRNSHVHGGTKVACVVPCLRRTKPIALSFVGYVIDAPSRPIGLVFHSVGQHERGKSEGCATPYFPDLLVGPDDRAIGANAIHGPHLTIGEFHNVELINFLQGSLLH